MGWRLKYCNAAGLRVEGSGFRVRGQGFWDKV